MLLKMGSTKILVVYRSPSAREEMDVRLDGIAETCGLLPDDYSLIVGDFNARYVVWNDTFTNPCGTQLLAWMDA